MVACGAIYFLLLMTYGYPFESFDHQNYINFLADPSPFFFEPIYTLAAYIIDLLDIDNRFLTIYLILGFLPSLLVLANNSKKIDQYFIYFWIFIKSSLIGFISQRFWFAEMWAMYFYIFHNKRIVKLSIIPGLIHFGLLANLPIFYYLKNGINRLFLFFFITINLFIIYFVLSDYKFLNYNYSRYLYISNDNSIIPSILNISILILINNFLTNNYIKHKLLIVIILTIIYKLIFHHIEVFSRIFQSSIDIILITIFLNLKNKDLIFILPIYVILFILSIIFVSSTGPEIILHHFNSIMNSIKNINQ